MPTGWIGSTRRATLPADWPITRRRILHRDRHTCRILGPRCIGLATEVDHIGERADHSDANLRSACRPCHHARSSSQGGAASGARRASLASARLRPTEPHPGMR